MEEQVTKRLLMETLAQMRSQINATEDKISELQQAPLTNIRRIEREIISQMIRCIYSIYAQIPQVNV